MNEMNVTQSVQNFAVKKALQYVNESPEKAFPKLMKWMEHFDKEGTVKVQMDAFKPIINDPDNNWYKLIYSLWEDIDDDVRMTFFENFVLNATVMGGRQQKKMAEKHQCNVPWAILMDPTSACNLKCLGCWAAEYGNQLNMSYDTMNDIIKQGKALGTYMYIFSGGEPLVRKADILKLCRQHPDCQFLSFTNATLIDDAFADQMLEVKNFVPAISVEGFEAETDSRRGKGTYQAVRKAMAILKAKKLPFGVSCCYTSQNANIIGSEAYFDELIDMGAKFAWFFTFMPVGVKAPTELIANAQQRKYMYDQIRKFRKTKPLFTLDFWNDGEYVNGCIAGGRKYLHINANGDIEPCAFIHYSDSSIYEKTLLDAYQSPLFMQYKAHQPFNDNHLRPCPLLDNQGALAEMVHASGAASTDVEANEDVDFLCQKCQSAAQNWKPVADELWENSQMFKMSKSS